MTITSTHPVPFFPGRVRKARKKTPGGSPKARSNRPTPTFSGHFRYMHTHDTRTRKHMFHLNSAENIAPPSPHADASGP